VSRDAEADVLSERGRSFGAFAEAYERARPEYPDEAVRWMTSRNPRFVVELGAGTGKLTRSLTAEGRRVLAVEPDPRMRALLGNLELDGVEPLDGTAEAIPAPDGVADLVVAGSAFHWFELDPALAEIARVLVPAGMLAFAWQGRDERIPWVREMNEVIRRGRPWPGNRPWGTLIPDSGLFGPLEEAEFSYIVRLPREALGDHVRSYSAVGSLPSDEREAVVRKVISLVSAEPSNAGSNVLELPFVVKARRTAKLRPPA
jgi:SAM-dependent methyltransferase